MDKSWKLHNAESQCAASRMGLRSLSTEAEEILSIVEEIYDAAADPSRWKNVFATLGRRFRSPVVGMFAKDTITGVYSGDWLAMDQEYQRLCADRFAAINPWFHTSALVRPGQVLTDQTLARIHRDCKAHAETDFDQEHAWLQRFHQTMGGTVFAHDHIIINFGYFRSAEEGPYTPAEIRLHTLLARHIGKAIGISRQLSVAQHECMASSRLIDRLPFGVIFLDARGFIKSTNREGSRLLADHDGLNTKGGLLCARGATEKRKLNALIRSVISEQGLAGGGEGDAHGSDFRLQTLRAHGALDRRFATHIRENAIQR